MLLSVLLYRSREIQCILEKYKSGSPALPHSILTISTKFDMHLIHVYKSPILKCLYPHARSSNHRFLRDSPSFWENKQRTDLNSRADLYTRLYSDQTLWRLLSNRRDLNRFSHLDNPCWISLQLTECDIGMFCNYFRTKTAANASGKDISWVWCIFSHGSSRMRFFRIRRCYVMNGSWRLSWDSNYSFIILIWHRCRGILEYHSD
jgi:hypothetical protein